MVIITVILGIRKSIMHEQVIFCVMHKNLLKNCVTEGTKKRTDFEVSENTDLVPYATLTMFNSTLEPIPDTHGTF